MSDHSYSDESLSDDEEDLDPRIQVQFALSSYYFWKTCGFAEHEVTKTQIWRAYYSKTKRINLIERS